MLYVFRALVWYARHGGGARKGAEVMDGAGQNLMYWGSWSDDVRGLA
jgi:hypothetical protein